MPNLTPDYFNLDSHRAQRLVDRLGVWVLIAGEVTKAIVHYPTAEQLLAREGAPAQGKSMRVLLRYPELHLHKQSGQFKKGDPVCVLCSKLPDLVCDEFYPSDSELYHVTLVEAQSKPVDTAGRKWQ